MNDTQTIRERAVPTPPPARPRTTTGIRYNDRNHRYSIDGSYVVSVTTALKGMPKQDALTRWAAGTVAEYVADNFDHVSRMLRSGGRGPTVAFLRGLPDQARDTAAVRGTDIHDFADRILRDEEVEVPEHLAPYVEGYLHYLEDWQPVRVYNEVVVGSRQHGYAGRLDSIQDVPSLGRVVIDNKTGKGVYGETALQVAAYRFADILMDGDTEMTMPGTDGAYTLHIQPNEYELIPLVADLDTFAKFLKAKDHYLSNVQSNKLNKLIGEPLAPPAREVS